jgi:TPR repeat protein
MHRKKPATVEEALRTLEAGRAVQAFRALKRLAENNDERAFHMLGYLYDVGEGTKRSRKSAMHWYLRSYHAGRAMSASNIATIYRDAGQHRREFEWYQRAAALGDGDARLEVAIRYLSGKGVRRSLSSAIGHLRAVLRTEETTEASRDTARQLLQGCETKRRAT